MRLQWLIACVVVGTFFFSTSIGFAADKQPGLPATAFLFLTVEAKAIMAQGRERSLTPVIARVDQISIPGNKRGFYDSDLGTCYVIAYAVFDPGQTVTFDSGKVACRLKEGDYGLAHYNAATVDNELNTELLTRPLAIASLASLREKLTASIDAIKKLEGRGLMLGSFVKELEALKLSELNPDKAFRQIPAGVHFAIALRQPLIFNP